MKKVETQKEYIVRENITEAPDVATLKFSFSDDTIPKYISGQFITVYFPETGVSEGKAYSISSAPQEKYLSITVRDIGKFSHRLCQMNIGDRLQASLPYGYFYSESVDTPLVLCAGGIGVTPLRSIIMNSFHCNPLRSIFLLYSVKEKKDILFKKEYDQLSATNKNFRVQYFVTREHSIPKEMTKGRINVEMYVKNIQSVVQSEFFLCGSIPFVRDLWCDLRKVGISEESIYTEAFF